MQIQRNLTKENGDNHNFNLKIMPNFKKRELINIDDYIYFHLKKSNFDKLGWGENELMMISEEFLKYNKNKLFNPLNYFFNIIISSQFVKGTYENS